MPAAPVAQCEERSRAKESAHVRGSKIGRVDRDDEKVTAGPGRDPEGTARALLRAAVEKVADSRQPISDFRGIAFYDTQKDDFFTSLSEFDHAVTALATVPLLAERLGAEERRRLALQLVYSLIERLNEPTYDDHEFDRIWSSFLEEIEDPNWTYRAVANLRNFTCDCDIIELEDGVSIQGRNFDRLAGLGFSSGVLKALSDDWHTGFGASSFVLVAVAKIEKTPQNLVLSGDPGLLWSNAQRAIRALRLLAPGDVTLSQMWVVRVARFNVGLGGISGIGFSIPSIGSPYALTDEVVSSYGEMYGRLRTLATTGYGNAPGNLDLALRAFMATYDRWPPGSDARLIDAITALEAVLGSGTEIAFKLAFRVASLLAATDDERGDLLETMKGYYDTRSALVHGGRLKQKHQERLEAVDNLRDLVRRVLVGVVVLATSDGAEYDKQFFQARLDAALVTPAERDALRAAMRLG